MGKICYPWCFYAEYKDGTKCYFYGNSEDECMQKVCDAISIYGECEYYTGIDDEDYAAGEYIGRDNFIYE